MDATAERVPGPGLLGAELSADGAPQGRFDFVLGEGPMVGAKEVPRILLVNQPPADTNKNLLGWVKPL
jgi:hypothetical protein